MVVQVTGSLSRRFTSAPEKTAKTQVWKQIVAVKVGNERDTPGVWHPPVAEEE